MKAFKIRKRKERIQTYIIGPSIGSFPKPKLPRVLITKVNKPNIPKD